MSKRPMDSEKESFVDRRNDSTGKSDDAYDSLKPSREPSASFEEAPALCERFVNGIDGVVYGKIISTLPTQEGTCCWYCRQVDPADDLYKPCSCDSLIHRRCFRQWRTGWINPRNYFSCPNCMFSYNMEQVKPPTTESKERMRANYRIGVAKVWIAVVLGFGALVAALAGISYGCDTSDKNIPVAVRCLLTSVVGGFPNANSTAQWREEFKEPNVPVWPYYSAFGPFLTSLMILTSFSCIGSTFNESDRRRSGHCNCVDDCCAGSNNGIAVWYFPTSHSGTCSCCDCMVDGHGCHGSNCHCGGGGNSSCNGDFGDAGAIIAVIVLIIVVIIIFSALVASVLYAVQKCSLLYDRLTAMLASQQSELEGETVVLGIGESWRPNNAV